MPEPAAEQETPVEVAIFPLNQEHLDAVISHVEEFLTEYVQRYYHLDDTTRVMAAKIADALSGEGPSFRLLPAEGSSILCDVVDDFEDGLLNAMVDGGGTVSEVDMHVVRLTAVEVDQLRTRVALDSATNSRLSGVTGVFVFLGDRRATAEALALELPSDAAAVLVLPNTRIDDDDDDDDDDR